MSPACEAAADSVQAEAIEVLAHAWRSRHRLITSTSTVVCDLARACIRPCIITACCCCDSANIELCFSRARSRQAFQYPWAADLMRCVQCSLYIHSFELHLNNAKLGDQQDCMVTQMMVCMPPSRSRHQPALSPPHLHWRMMPTQPPC